MKNKIAMVWIINNLTTNLNSHNWGFTLVSKDILENHFEEWIDLINEKDDWLQYDILIINEWVNYVEWSYNLFWWVSDKLLTKIDKLKDFKWQIYCVNEDFDVKNLIKKRKELNHIEFPDQDRQIISLDIWSKKMILWDSHSLSVYHPWFCLNRHDWKTLNWFLKNWIKEYLNEDTNELMFYAWNIDIRFHINRFSWLKTIQYLIDNLEKQLQNLDLKIIYLIWVLPPEEEDRKLPKTWQYKWKNFYWNREQRAIYSRFMNILLREICDKNGWLFLEWDFNYYKPLHFDYMEQRQSVHLRPKHYMFNKLFIKN